MTEARRRIDPRIRRIALACLFSLLAACAGERPLVERFEQGAWQPTSYRILSVGGQRAAATVVFVIRLEQPEGRKLIVEGTVEIDPQARLVDGRWSEEWGSAARTGVVSSAAVDFFGGQGGRPSLGGRFTLSDNGSEAYRINLPASELSTER